MKRWLILLLVLLPPTSALAQYNPYAPVNGQSDPRVRRALREQAVAYAGPAAREFVESQGDDAVAALLACSQPVARKLAEAHTSLSKTPKPRELFKAIATAGDDAALWALQHHQTELMDVDNTDAFCSEPLQYALGLKPISEGGAQVRARRLAAQTVTSPTPNQQWQVTLDAPKLAVIGGVFVVVLLCLWLRKRRGSHAL